MKFCKSWKSVSIIGIVFIILTLSLPIVINKSTIQDDNGFTINEKPENKARVLFDSKSPTEATIRRASNYNFVYDVTDVVEYADGWTVAFNKKFVLNVKWEDNLHDGDIITFKARLYGACPERKLQITAPNDPSTIYGEYEFHDSSNWWFNVTLDIENEINEFDVVIHYSCRSNKYLEIDYISFDKFTDYEHWRDIGGGVITKYQISFDYRVNTSTRVDPSTIRLEVEANASIVTPAGSEWINRHGSFYEVFPVIPYETETWSSRWVALPTYPAPFCAWNETDYGDSDYSSCSDRTQMNITVTVIVRAYGKLFDSNNYVVDLEVEQNIRNYPIFWY